MRSKIAMNLTSKGIRLAKTMVISALLVPIFVGEGSAEPIVMRIALLDAESDAATQGVYMFEQYVERALPGQIDVQIYPNSSLVDQSRMLPALQRGNIEGAQFSMQRFASEAPLAGLYGAAYLFRDRDHLCTVHTGEFGRSTIAQVEEAFGLKALGTSFHGVRMLGLGKVRDIESPTDMAGLKLRVPGQPAWIALGEALGGNPTPIPFSEQYLAMQTGTIDAFEGTPGVIEQQKLNEVAAEISQTNHLVVSLTTWTSQDFWNSLSEEQKIVLEEAGRVYSIFASNNKARHEAGALSRLAEFGVKVTTPDIDAFRSHARDVYATSDLAESWPDAIYEQVASTASNPDCTF